VRRRAALLTFWLLACRTSARAPDPPPTADAHYRLANGLEVILRRDARQPLIAVHLRYHVGAVDDPPDRRGLAHVVEHLMFEGSRHIDVEAREQARARAFIHRDNAETDLHVSDYHTVAAPGSLATILWLESDRMAHLRRSLDAAALARVQAIVAQERSLRRETDPRGATLERLYALLFPPAHPYHATVMGPHAAIAAIHPAEVDAFLAAHYTPANATLTIVGDLPPTTRALIHRHFAALPSPVRKASSDLPAPRPRPALPVITGGGTLQATATAPGPPTLRCAWISPAAHADGDAALDILFTALGSGAFRRLAGPDERMLAKFDAGQASQPQQSVALAELFGEPGVDPRSLLDLLDRVLDRAAAGELTPAELERARRHHANDPRIVAQDLLTRADMISGYATAFGDPDAITADIAQWRAVTDAEVAAAARTLRTADRRAVLLTTP
jgi:zinc protease